MRKKIHGFVRRLIAAIVCLNLSLSIVSGMGFPAFAASSGRSSAAVNPAQPTEHILEFSRVADPDTMDSYTNILLNKSTGSRYAGRVWTDKSVFAYKDGNSYTSTHFKEGTNTLTLDMTTDGYNGDVSFSADFLHVFSALASSQVVNEYPPSPIDLVIVFDMSGSMGQDTRFGIDVGINNYVAHNNSKDVDSDGNPLSGDKAWPEAGVPMAERIENSRIQKTLDAINETIDTLMEQNPQNRVAVCGYGANAVVLMPLGHYKRNGEADYLSVGGMETLYHPSDLVYRTVGDEVKKGNENLPKVTQDGWYWMNNRDTCYTVVVDAMYNTYTGILDTDGDAPSDKQGEDENYKWTTITKTVSNNVRTDDGTKAKAFPGEWKNGEPTNTYAEQSKTVYEGSSSSDPAIAESWVGGLNGVMNYPTDKGGPGARTSELKEAMKPTNGLHADDYVGYFTNTQGGIYLAYKQLADSTSTTYTEPLSNGVISTVARIPAAIIMSDGGANFALNEMGDENKPYTAEDWNARYGQRTKEDGNITFNYMSDDSWTNNSTPNWNLHSGMTADGQRQLTDGRPKDAHHRLGGVQNDKIEQDGDEWYKVYLPGKDTLGEKWDGLHGIYNQGADITEDGTLSSPPAWNHAGVFYSSDNDVTGTAGTVMEVLLTASYMSEVVKEHYDNGWAKDNATKDSRIELSTYTMNVDTVHVPLWGKMRLYPTLDPKDYNLENIEEWYNDPKNNDKFGTDAEIQATLTGDFSVKEKITKDVIFKSGNVDNHDINGLEKIWEDFKNKTETGGPNQINDNGAPQNIVIKPISESSTYTNADGEEIEITNDEVVDNIAYNDMFYDVGSENLNDIFSEILALILGKVFVPVSGNNDAGVGDSITYQDPIGDYMEIKNGAVTYRNSKKSEGAADMSMLLFGEMYGLVRTGIYDYKWNDEWMETHDTAHQGQLAFTQGWYKGEAASAESGGSGELPTDNNGLKLYETAEKAWADGWVYRINYKTLIQYVPIVNAKESDTPESMPPQVQNTVYTIYRFSCSKAERNKLRRNPVYGEVPDDLKKAWENETAGGKYPNNDSLYEDYPGVYRLSDIRVWVEYYGDFVDQDGAITTDRGYDSSLYLNIPAAAIPTELATITLGRNGVLSYKTNLGSDHPVGSYDTVVTKDASGNEVEQKIQVDEAMYNSYCYQSTPLRLFYTVGLEEDLIIREADGKQIGVNVAALPEEYVSTHTIAERSTIYFVSNYFSATKYNDYVTGESTRGDPAVTFSPSSDNRYYVFQKPLPLYAHAYRVQANGSLLPVDRNDGQTWGKNLGGNGKTVWEDTEDGKTGGSSWLGGVYMGVYESEKAFKNAATETSASLSPSGVGMPKTDKLIKDSQGIWYPYVENGIVFLTSDLLDNVDENSGKSFESDDYFFLLLEYYTPGDEVGVNNSGEPLYGTNSGSTIQYAVARKGSDFGSGFASTEINNGDMLCWAETQGKLNLSNNVGFKYLSFTETGDKTRGRPTFEKLTLDESALKTYLKDNCGIQNEAVLSEQAEYWQTMQNDPQVQAALEAAKAAQTGNKDKLTEEGFNAYFKFAVSARPGGIRTGNMANERQRKTPNPTETSETYYVPTVSNSSSIQNIVLNSYLGNNGRLEVGNSQLLVTKTLHIPEDYTYGSELNKDEIFNYQIYIAGARGNMDATMVNYNPISKLWQCRIGYIDVLVDTNGMLLTSDNEPALFVYEGGTAKQVTAVTDDDNTSYYYVNDEGGPDLLRPCNSNPALYYLYLPKDPGSSDDSDKLTRRIYQDSDYNDESDKITGFENSAVMYYGTDQTKPADSANDGIRYEPLPSSEITEGSEITAGTVVYEIKEAELVPKSEVDGNESWSHVEGVGNHHKIEKYPIATVKPNAHDSTQEIISPFGTKTMYMKKTLEFGKNANSDGTSSGELTASDLYDQFNPSHDRSDLFGTSDNATIASSTAEFALKQGEGLLLTGLGNRVAYRFTEKLTDEQIAKGYVLEQINHIQQIGSESIYKLGLQEVPIYVKEDDSVTYADDPEGTPTTEPFHHTNATMWEYYATFGPNEYSSHHYPEQSGVKNNPACTTYDETTKTGCDVSVDGNIRHYMYREGELIDSHYEGEPSSFSNRISRYLVSPTVHFGIDGDSEYSQYSAANIEKYECSEKYNGVYSVFGNTGYFEEQANFTNTVKLGSLTVEKKISLEEKDSSKVKTEITDDEKEFEFKFEVQLSGKNIDGEYKAQKMTRKVQETGGVYGPTFESVSPEYITVTFKSGKAEFTLKGGESLTIYGIPLGTTYTVTEKAEGRGYWKPTVSVDGSSNSDGAVATGTITEKGGKAECTVTFDNKKPNPEPVYVSIGLTKKVTIIGEDSHFEEYPEISAEDFTFEVTPDSGNGEDDPFKKELENLNDVKKIVEIGAGSNYTATANIFENLQYEKKGTYKYYVKEIVPESEEDRIDGMTYSDVRYTIEVVVTEDTVTEGESNETRLALKADVYVYTDDRDKGEPVASSTGKVDAGNEKIAFENIIGGELIITKEVVNAPENDNTEFNFTLELTLNSKHVVGPFPYVITKDGKEVKSGHLISSGSGEGDDIVADGNVWTLTLKNGESITIKELPTGAAYKITEADSENSHYLFKSVSVEGGTPSEDKTVKGVIGASGVGDIVTVSYKNEYVGSMTISKALAIGSDPDTDTEFEFKLTLTPPKDKGVEDLEDVNITPSAVKEKGDGTVTYTFKLKADGNSVTLTDIPMGTSYTLTETPNAEDNYVFDSVTVGGNAVEKSADGIIGIISKESSDIDIVVTNKPCTPTKVSLEGTKNVIGADFKLGDKFKFQITRTSASGPDPNPDVVSESTDGTIRFFDNLEFTEPGTYTYTIKEVKSPSIEGIEYDDTVYTVTVEVSETDNGELKATVSYLKGGETADSIIFENSHKLGSLKVRKIIDDSANQLSDDYKKDLIFNFKLTLKNDNIKSFEPLLDNQPLKKAEDGDYWTFTLTGNDTIEITNLPVGTECSVEETDSLGFTPKYDPEDHEAVIKGTEVVTITVTNKNPDSTELTLTGKKTFKYDDGAGIDLKGGEFEFILSAEDDKTPMPDEGTIGTTKTVTNLPGGSFSFGKITYKEVGTYKYTVREVHGSEPNYTYDTSVYNVTVTVSKDSDALKANVDVKKGGQPVDLTSEGAVFEFTNTKKRTPTELNLTGKKTFKYDDEAGIDLKGGEFKFILSAEDDKTPMPDEGTIGTTKTVTNLPGGSFSFGKITYKEVGTYKYTVREVHGSEPNYTYDTSVYNVTVTVSKDGDALKAKAAVTKKDETGETVEWDSENIVFEFTNTKKRTPAEITFNGTKKLAYTDGEVIVEVPAGEFEFTLKAVTKGAPMPEGSKDAAKTVTNLKGGSFNFGKITYKEVGTYSYTVSEVRGSEPNYTYDTSVYIVTVTVSKNGDALKADVEVTKKDETGNMVEWDSENTVFEFTNTKKRTPTELTIEGLKNLDGNPSGVEFSFGIRPASESPADIPMPENTTVYNNGEGKFFFGPIKYTAAGEYVYEIYEIPNPNEDKYVYDTTVYRITVRVTEEGGGLTAEYGASEEVTTTARIVYYATVINGMAVPAATPNMGGGIIFNNTTVIPIGSLTISKIVKNEDGSIVDDGSDTTLFDFTVKLVAPEGTSLPSTYVPDEGKDYMSFRLAAGQSMSFSNLPVGTEYYISEVNQQGYTCENPEVNGVITENGETVAVDIVNIKPAPKQKTGNLEVIKHVIGDGDKTKEWHITVTLGEALTGQYGDMYFENGVAKLTVTDGVTVTAVGLPVGITYTVAELEENTGGYVTTYVGKTGEIPADGTAHAEVVNDLPATPPPSESETGSLTVEKTVQSPDPNDYMRPFGFVVQLSDPTINGCYGDMVFSDGVAYITLTSGQSLTAVGLPVGISYSIYETDAYGFTVLVNGMPSSGVASGTILSDSVSFEAFTNISNIPEPEYGGLTVTKTVEGSGADYEKYFTFTVTLSEPLTGQYGQMFFNNGVAVFTLKHGESCTAFGIPAGTYYTVTEYDNEGYEVTSVGEVGTVIANTVVSADFVNTREEPEDEPEEDKGGLTVKKTVTGSDGDRFKEFTFTVTLSDSSINGVYGDMIFVDGVAAFTLRHGESITASGLPAGISYTVTETDNEGYTVVSFGETGTIPANGEAVAEFVNSRGDSDEFGNLTVEKFVTGFGIDYQDFTFTVTLSAPITGQYGQMFFNDGVAVFTLKHGETATAVGLPAGVSYTVVESNNDYYIVSSSGDAGIIVNNGSAYCEYINYLTEEDYPKVVELLEQPTATVDTNPPTGIDYIDYMGTVKILLVIVALGVVVKRIKER